MAIYSTIAVIYNPQSTGDSRRLAEAFAAELRVTADLAVTLVPTKHAGHAEELARELSTASPRPLIVSSSGDGGYHEVVNGVMAGPGADRAVTALLPGGNANDHWHHYHGTDGLVDQIARGAERRIDLIELVATYADGTMRRRYAHSYVGLGLSPAVGRELNRTHLNRFNELWIVLRTVLAFRPVTLIIDGEPRRLDSLIVANVGRMGKHVKLDPTAGLTDGVFEVALMPHRSRWYVLWTLVRSAVRGLDGTYATKEFKLTTMTPLSIQLDGEVFALPAATVVTLRLAPAALRCVV